MIALFGKVSILRATGLFWAPEPDYWSFWRTLEQFGTPHRPFCKMSKTTVFILFSEGRKPRTLPFWS